MNVNNALRNRAMGIRNKISIDFTINKMSLQQALKFRYLEDNQESSGPLACVKLEKGNSNIIAVANEDGYIDLIKMSQLNSLDQWIAHDNAIFDIKSTPDSRTLLTASGDKTIKLWDIETKKNTLTISNHFSTVKSISVYDCNVLASGSRDGTIKIHDIRSPKPTKIVIRDAHRNLIIAKPRRNLKKTDPVSCVTNVVFDQHQPRIYSAGANDAILKLWDLRKTPTANKPKRTIEGELLVNEPYISVHHPSKGVHCGYSHLLLSNNSLYAACSDNKIYRYDNFGPGCEPIKFVGYHYDTYLKMAVLDDRFLLSGAKRGGAIMWSLGENSKSSYQYIPVTTRLAIGQLKPDENESFDTNVIETDWNSLSVFTFRDDRLVCKWTMNHISDSERKKLMEDNAIASQEADVAIEMSDVIDISVLRPNCRINNALQLTN